MPGKEYSMPCRTRFGTFRVLSVGEAVTGLLLPSQLATDRRGSQSQQPQVLHDACQQLHAYCEGELQTFALPLAPQGTGFQQTVWSELCRVPFGATITYLQLAIRIGRPNAARAVGAANGRNPLPIFVPCHRVVGSDGSLTGYAGGVELKRQLIEHEMSRARMASGV